MSNDKHSFEWFQENYSNDQEALTYLKYAYYHKFVNKEKGRVSEDDAQFNRFKSIDSNDGIREHSFSFTFVDQKDNNEYTVKTTIGEAYDLLIDGGYNPYPSKDNPINTENKYSDFEFKKSQESNFEEREIDWISNEDFSDITGEVGEDIEEETEEDEEIQSDSLTSYNDDKKSDNKVKNKKNDIKSRGLTPEQNEYNESTSLTQENDKQEELNPLPIADFNDFPNDSYQEQKIDSFAMYGNQALFNSAIAANAFTGDGSGIRETPPQQSQVDKTQPGQGVDSQVVRDGEVLKSENQQYYEQHKRDGFEDDASGPYNPTNASYKGSNGPSGSNSPQNDQTRGPDSPDAPNNFPNNPRNFDPTTGTAFDSNNYNQSTMDLKGVAETNKQHKSDEAAKKIGESSKGVVNQVVDSGKDDNFKKGESNVKETAGIAKNVMGCVFAPGVSGTIGAEKLSLYDSMKNADMATQLINNRAYNITHEDFSNLSASALKEKLRVLKDNNGNQLLSNHDINGLAYHTKGTARAMEFRNSVTTAQKSGFFGTANLTSDERKALDKFSKGKLSNLSSRDINNIVSAYFKADKTSILHKVNINSLTAREISDLLSGADSRGKLLSPKARGMLEMKLKASHAGNKIKSLKNLARSLGRIIAKPFKQADTLAGTSISLISQQGRRVLATIAGAKAAIKLIKTTNALLKQSIIVKAANKTKMIQAIKRHRVKTKIKREAAKKAARQKQSQARMSRMKTDAKYRKKVVKKRAKKKDKALRKKARQEAINRARNAIMKNRVTRVLVVPFQVLGFIFKPFAIVGKALSAAFSWITRKLIAIAGIIVFTFLGAVLSIVVVGALVTAISSVCASAYAIIMLPFSAPAAEADDVTAKMNETIQIEYNKTQEQKDAITQKVMDKYNGGPGFNGWDGKPLESYTRIEQNVSPQCPDNDKDAIVFAYFTLGEDFLKDDAARSELVSDLTKLFNPDDIAFEDVIFADDVVYKDPSGKLYAGSTGTTTIKYYAIDEQKCKDYINSDSNCVSSIAKIPDDGYFSSDLIHSVRILGGKVVNDEGTAPDKKHPVIYTDNVKTGDYGTEYTISQAQDNAQYTYTYTYLNSSGDEITDSIKLTVADLNLTFNEYTRKKNGASWDGTLSGIQKPSTFTVGISRIKNAIAKKLGRNINFVSVAGPTKISPKYNIKFSADANTVSANTTGCIDLKATFKQYGINNLNVFEDTESAQSPTVTLNIDSYTPYAKYFQTENYRDLIADKKGFLELINSIKSQDWAEYYGVYSGSGIGGTYVCIDDPGPISKDQKAILDVIRNGTGLKAPEPGWCAAWVSGVLVKACPQYWPTTSMGDAITFWLQWGTNDGITSSTSWENIPVGAVVVGSGYGADPLSYRYGHVGIYVGNNVVAENIGGVSLTDLNTWINNQTAICHGYKGFIGWVFPYNIDITEKSTSSSKPNQSDKGDNNTAPDISDISQR